MSEETELQRLFRLKKKKRGLQSRSVGVANKVRRGSAFNANAAAAASLASSVPGSSESARADVKKEPRTISNMGPPSSSSMAPPSNLANSRTSHVLPKPPAFAVKPAAAAPAAVPTKKTPQSSAVPIDPGHRQRLLEFYQRFNPTKVGDVDGLLLKYRGKETKLFRSLLKKYPQAASVLSNKLPSHKEPATDVVSAEAQKAQVLAAQTAAKVAAAATAAAEAEAFSEPEVSGSLPKGFFDDQERDMQARNVDPEEVKRRQQEAEWQKFQAFAQEATADDEDPEIVAARAQEEREAHAAHEQKQYKSRIARLAAMRERMKQKQVKQESSADSDTRLAPFASPEPKVSEMTEKTENTPSVDAFPDDDADSEGNKVADVLSIMKNVKKTRDQKLRALSEKEYVPLNPLDWRSKSTE